MRATPYPRLSLIPPNFVKRKWLHTSGNQQALASLCRFFSADPHSCHPVDPHSCSPADLPKEYAHSRVILVEGAGGAGLTALLREFESRAKHMKLRVLSLQQGTEADERYLLSNLVEELAVPLTRWSDFSSALGTLHERVFILRNYRFIVIHDMQRFLSFSPRVTRQNCAALIYLLSSYPGLNLVIGGDFTAIEKCMTALHEYQPQKITISPMLFDQAYKDFVTGALNRQHATRVLTDVEMASLYSSTNGYVGETLISLSFVLSIEANKSSGGSHGDNLQWRPVKFLG